MAAKDDIELTPKNKDGCQIIEIITLPEPLDGFVEAVLPEDFQPLRPHVKSDSEPQVEAHPQVKQNLVSMDLPLEEPSHLQRRKPRHNPYQPEFPELGQFAGPDLPGHRFVGPDLPGDRPGELQWIDGPVQPDGTTNPYLPAQKKAEDKESDNEAGDGDWDYPPTDLELSAELFRLCRTPFTYNPNFHFHQPKIRRKLKSICDYVTKVQGRSLCEPSLCGAEYTETCLHTAIMYNNYGAIELLIEYGDALILQPYSYHDTRGDLRGTTALHLVIAKNINRNTLKAILDKLDKDSRKTYIHERATIELFDKTFVASGLPLTMALVTGNYNLYCELLEQGADFTRKDPTSGFTILHSLVEHSLQNPTMAQGGYKVFMDVDESEEHPQDKVNFFKTPNHYLTTPLVLACQLGATEMIKDIFNTPDLYKYPQWEYGPAVLDYYDVTQMENDSIKEVGQYGGLELLVYNNKTASLPIFQTEPIQSLVMARWKAYRPVFWGVGVVHLVCMVIFTICAVSDHYPNRGQGGKGWLITGDTICFMYALLLICSEFCDVSYAVYIRWQRHRKALLNWREFNIVQDAEEGKGSSSKLNANPQDTSHKEGEQSPLSQSKHKLASCFTVTHDLAPEKIGLRMTLKNSAFFGFRFLTFVFAICVLVWFVLRRVSSEKSNVGAVVPLILGWYCSLFFARASRDIGLFTIMISKILMRDFLHFLIVFGTLLIGFTMAVVCMFPIKNPLSTNISSSIQNSDGSIPMQNSQLNDTSVAEEDKLEGTLFTSIWGLMRLAVGLIDMEDTAEVVTYKMWARVLILCFIILVMLLLLNMLIAAMTDTYAEVRDNKDALWIKSLAESTLMLERRLPPALRPKLKCVQRNLTNQLSGEKEKLYFLQVHQIDPDRKSGTRRARYANDY